MPPPPPRRRVAPAPIEWLFLAVGLGLILRYRWILDDSGIYWRYVDNWLFLHRGLVFNQGEYAEGYSSPLWLLVLALVRLTRLDYWTLTTGLAIGTFAAFWYAAVVVNRTLQGDSSGPTIDVPLVYLSTCYAVACYFSSGSESPLMQLAAGGVALFALKPESRWLPIALGTLPLVRNEFVVPAATLVVCTRIATGRTPWRLVASTTFCGAAWLTFRIGYYADLFPTTYYLKDKVSIAQGVYYVANAITPYALPAYLATAGVMLALLAREKKGDLLLGPRALMAIVALSSMAYVVKVGGDMMHYRLLAFPFCLIVLSTGGLAERWLTALGVQAGIVGRSLLASALGAVGVAVYPGFLSAHPLTGNETRELDSGISDAAWHRHAPDLTFSIPRRSANADLLRAYAISDGGHTAVKSHTACVNMFWDYGTRWVHGYGLTEPLLARIAVPDDRPGHKERLRDLARELAALRSRTTDAARALDDALAAGTAPHWASANADKVHRVEARMYNTHNLLENLGEALKRIGPLEP